jgi:hypothetical protein
MVYEQKAHAPSAIHTANYVTPDGPVASGRDTAQLVTQCQSIAAAADFSCRPYWQADVTARRAVTYCGSKGQGDRSLKLSGRRRK